MKDKEGNYLISCVTFLKDYSTNNFVNLKSNSALLYNKGHNLLPSAFPPKDVKLINFHKKVEFSRLKEILPQVKPSQGQVEVPNVVGL